MKWASSIWWTLNDDVWKKWISSNCFKVDFFKIFVIHFYVLPIILTQHMDICFGKWYFYSYFIYIYIFSTSYILVLLCFEFAHEKFLNWKHSQVIHLNYHNCGFIRLQFNIKCKVIFNLEIIKILIIYVVVDLSGNHIRIYIWDLRK
jgi:hypothetical protein